MAGILFKDESYRIMGAMFEVYKEMGCGFLEPVYQECVEFELADQKVPFVAQIHNYLKATGFRLGIIVNFGHYPKVEYERIVR